MQRTNFLALYPGYSYQLGLCQALLSMVYFRKTTLTLKIPSQTSALLPENPTYPSVISCVTHQVIVHLGFSISFSVKWEHHPYCLHTFQGRQSTKQQMLLLRRVSVMLGKQHMTCHLVPALSLN